MWKPQMFWVFTKDSDLFRSKRFPWHDESSSLFVSISPPIFFVVRLLSTFRGFAQSYCPLLWVVAFKVSTNRDSLQFIRPFYGEYFILIFPTLSANIRKLPVFSAFCWLFPPVSGNFHAVLNWTFGIFFFFVGSTIRCNPPACSIIDIHCF